MASGQLSWDAGRWRSCRRARARAKLRAQVVETLLADQGRELGARRVGLNSNSGTTLTAYGLYKLAPTQRRARKTTRSFFGALRSRREGSRRARQLNTEGPILEAALRHDAGSAGFRSRPLTPTARPPGLLRTRACYHPIRRCAAPRARSTAPVPATARSVPGAGPGARRASGLCYALHEPDRPATSRASSLGGRRCHPSRSRTDRLTLLEGLSNGSIWAWSRLGTTFVSGVSRADRLRPHGDVSSAMGSNPASVATGEALGLTLGTGTLSVVFGLLLTLIR